MKGKLKTYFRNKGFFDYRRGWDKGTCLYCGSEFKAGVNLYRDFYHCFVCEEKNKLINVVMEVEDLGSFGETLKFLRALEETPYSEPRVKRPEVPESVLPTGYINIRRGSGEYADRARAYVESRGVSIDLASKKGLGYTLHNEDYFGRIIIPFLVNGKCNYFQGRAFLKIDPKFKNPPEEETGIGKSLVIYNHDALSKHSEIDITESVFNSLTLNPTGIGINGKEASNWQFSNLLKAPKPKLYNIILDPDAVQQAFYLARRLAQFFPLRVIILPENEDVNSLGKEFVEEVRAKTPVTKGISECEKLITKYEANNKPRRVRTTI